MTKFGILVNLPSIGVGSFNKLMPSVRHLQYLELQNCNTIGEQGVKRLLTASAQTLTYVSLPYHNKTVNHTTLQTLSAMQNLSTILLG